MSQDTDQIDPLSRDVVNSVYDADGSSRYDNLVIDDRPSLYSVAEPEPSYSVSQLKVGSTSVTDPHLMVDKLKSEIAHLEKWLSHQGESRSRSLSLVNTIRSLIATRKSLLENLLQKD